MGVSKSKPERRITLVGKTGEGKSSAGNTILRKQEFACKASANSETAESNLGDGMVDGRKITVIDTPGIFDTRHKEEDIKSEIIRIIIECAPAVEAVLIVLKVGRYTEQENMIVNKIIEYCGEATFKHAVVLFTYGEQLEGKTIEEFVKESQKLQEVVAKCGGRCHVIDNTYWKKRIWGNKSNKVQVRNLMETIDKMVKENGFYTNELLQIVEEEIQEEMMNSDEDFLLPEEIQEEMMNSDEDFLLPEENRERAVQTVFKRLCIRFAGVATGTLIGAFLGIGVAVASVVALLKAAKMTKVCKAIATTVTAASTLAGTVAGTVATVEAGVAAGAGIGAAAGTGIAAGVILGAAALAGAIGGGITGYKAVEEADSVCEAIKMAAEANYENTKGVVKKAEQLPSDVYKRIKNN